MTIVIALALSLLIGLSLGLLGGGGSILTVPILVYALGLEPKSAIATSLLVVAITSVAAVVPHARAGRVQWRTALLFGAAGMIGAYLAGSVAHFIPAEALLVAFAAMMLVTAVAMMRGRKCEPAADAEARPERPLPVGKVMVEGLVVGAVTGLVGAGGGFLVVPALVLLGGLPMHVAVGTSLVVIGMKSLAGFAGYLGHVQIDWALAGLVSAAAVVGSVAGGRLAGRLPQETLRKGFAWFVVAMGAFMMAEQLPSLMGHPIDWAALPGAAIGAISTMEHFTPLASALGGALIGLSAAAMLLLLGRVAGVSGIFAGLLESPRGELGWRLAFVLGLVAGGVVMSLFAPSLFAVRVPRSLLVVGAAGLLVGFGTRLGGGCTSGHGVCGLARLSARSLVATFTFMATGGLTVFFTHHLLGGPS